MKHNPILELEPKALWKYFHEISQIPRCSGNEEGVRRYLIEKAESHNLVCKTDEAGNIVISVPASKGYESRRTAVLQGHMDMVCEKNGSTKHDFSTDPIELQVTGDRVTANETTLGADNGIALAMGLALLDTNEPHGPLELLFTVDEESGLTGALELDPSLLTGRILLNLDSEEEGVFYIGCAGGCSTAGEIPLEWSTPQEEAAPLSLSIAGLRGGHSGANIHEGRGNAVKLGARVLWMLQEEFSLRLARMEGGGKHNAIPREFFAEFTVSEQYARQVHTRVEEYGRIFAEELGDIEPCLTVKVKEKDEPPRKVLSPKTTTHLINALYLIPHGVDEMSREIKGLVETSTNLASVRLEGGFARILTSQRSSLASKRDDIRFRTAAAMRSAGASVEYLSMYPAWTPDPHNPLISICSDAYRKLFEAEPTITAIHAGLESGVIGDKFSDMQMISFGPDLYDVHTPAEALSITSAEHTWRLLLSILCKL